MVWLKEEDGHLVNPVFRQGDSKKRAYPTPSCVVVSTDSLLLLAAIQIHTLYTRLYRESTHWEKAFLTVYCNMTRCPLLRLY